MMAFRRQCTCAKFIASPYAFFTTHGKFVSSGLYESIDFYGHVDQFTFLRSEGGGVPALLLILYGYYTVEPSPWH